MALPAILSRAVPVGTMKGMEDDAEATQLVLETLFDVRAAVYEIHDYLLGDDDGEEEEEEDA